VGSEVSPESVISVGAGANTAFLTEWVKTVVDFAAPFLQFVEILYNSFHGLERVIVIPARACLRVEAEA
jgi:hypothetical protein